MSMEIYDIKFHLKHYCFISKNPNICIALEIRLNFVMLYIWTMRWQDWNYLKIYLKKSSQKSTGRDFKNIKEHQKTLRWHVIMYIMIVFILKNIRFIYRLVFSLRDIQYICYLIRQAHSFHKRLTSSSFIF